MANPKFDGDPLIEELRRRYPKKGPNPKPDEPLDHWAEKYLVYVRKKYNLKGEEK